MEGEPGEPWKPGAEDGFYTLKIRRCISIYEIPQWQGPKNK